MRASRWTLPLIRKAHRSDQLSSTSTWSVLSRHVNDLQREVNVLEHRTLYLEERLRAVEDQHSSFERRLTWVESVVQRIRSLASQLC